MSTAGNYDFNHWTKQLSKYLDQDWSHRPSPFALLASTYIKPGSRVLELGTGAGQDGIWLASQGAHVVMSDATPEVFDEIRVRAAASKVTNFETAVVDLTQAFPFEDASFDAVYAQLVLHYFDDETMHRIMREIRRVLSPNGLLAAMVNAVTDPEYDPSRANEMNMMIVDGLPKRYFSVESFQPFVSDYDPILFNNLGRTPKDDATGNYGLIQFIGIKQ